MNARRLAYSFAFALLAAPAAALACTDGGPTNGACNDGGAQWIRCTDHAQCPEGQYCAVTGNCGCGSRDAGVCDERGCHDCFPQTIGDAGPDSGLDCRNIRYLCPAPGATDAAVDAGAVVDAGTVNMDGGAVLVDAGVVDAGVVDAGGGGDGCSVRAPGDRATGSPLAVLAALVGIAALARVRRR